VLSGLTVCAALTALVAGVAGAWSPCGFSMVETIGDALGDTRRAVTLAASIAFTAGALVGGVVTFGGLAVVGRLLDAQAGGLGEAMGAALALAAAVADWRGVRIAPQIRRQVPESWRRRAPLAVACGLYGVLLGLAFTTFVLAFAVWALAGISLAAGDPTLGVAIGVAFGAGRAAPVLWMAPGMRDGRGARRLDRMAGEPRLWLGLRRLDALGLSLCALLLSGASATAAIVVPGATDPSAAPGGLAWQAVNGPGELHRRSGTTAIALPGSYPALGGSLIAWQGAGLITVADASSLAPVASIPAANVSALAVSNDWVVYRGAQADGGESIIASPLASPATARTIAGARPAGELGRPAIDGSEVVFALDTPRSSAIEMVNLASGAWRVLRFAPRAALLNPSLLNGRLLYERVSRCSQELRLGAAGNGRHERVLLRLASTVRRDPGYQPGYEHAYNSGSRCRNRHAGRGARMRLGPTALSASRAYVTEIPSSSSVHARIVSRAR
jgi:hypothetical protein